MFSLYPAFLLAVSKIYGILNLLLYVSQQQDLLCCSAVGKPALFNQWRSFSRYKLFIPTSPAGGSLSLKSQKKKTGLIIALCAVGALALAAVLILVIGKWHRKPTPVKEEIAPPAEEEFVPPAEEEIEESPPELFPDDKAPAEAFPEEAAPAEEPVADAKKGYVIDNLVLMDNESAKLTFVSAEDNPYSGFVINAIFENKTEDKELMFSLDNVTVNRFQDDPIWIEIVEPGQTLEVPLDFNMASDIFLNMVKSYDEISFSLYVSDWSDWTADYLVEENFTIYPTGLTAEQIVPLGRPTTPNEKVVVDNKDLLFVILEPTEDTFMGFEATYYVENRTGSTISFYLSDGEVNGIDMPILGAENLSAGTKTVGSLSFLKTDFEQNGIKEIREIEFEMEVMNLDTFAEIADLDVVYRP